MATRDDAADGNPDTSGMVKALRRHKIQMPLKSITSCRVFLKRRMRMPTMNGVGKTQTRGLPQSKEDLLEVVEQVTWRFFDLSR